MSATTTEVQTSSSAAREFLRQRLATILALAPLGVWVVIHIWNNLAAFSGEEAWQRSVTHHPHPLAMAMTWFVVLVPLVLHTIWGVKRVVQSRPNNTRYGYFSNLRYLLQRVSAIGVLAFVGAHLWLAFLHPRFVEGHAERFGDIAREMHHHTPTLVVYVLGTLGVAYHLANGVATSAMAFGFGTSQVSQKRMERLALVLFAILLAMSWAAIYGLWSAGATRSV